MHFYWWRDRSAHQVYTYVMCLTVTKANFLMRTTCYYFVVVFFLSLCIVFCFLRVLFLWLWVLYIFLNIIIFPFVLPLQSTLQGFTPFFCLISFARFECMLCALNIFRVKIWICFYFLLFDALCAFALTSLSFCISVLCKHMHKNHNALLWFFAFLCASLTLSISFSVVRLRIRL